jgi:hypothetical protein
MLFGTPFDAHSSAAAPLTYTIGKSCVPSDEYYLRQAEVTARMALAESDPNKAGALRMLALRYFEQAENAGAGRITPAYQIPDGAKDRDLGK